MARFLLIVILLVSTSQSLAQSSGDSSTVRKYGPRRQISTIVYMGLAGAVLGLSTLSFYGRPQDHLTNIPLGFGIGVVAGTIYMTYQAAANPDVFYRESRLDYLPQPHLAVPEYKMASDLFVQRQSPNFSYQLTF